MKSLFTSRILATLKDIHRSFLHFRTTNSRKTFISISWVIKPTLEPPMAVRSRRRDQTERYEPPNTPTAEQTNIYTIITTKPTEEESVGRAGVTEADLDRPSIWQPVATRFDKSRLSQTLLSFWPSVCFLRCAVLSTKIKFTRMSSLKSFRFAAVTATRVKIGNSGERMTILMIR